MYKHKNKQPNPGVGLPLLGLAKKCFMVFTYLVTSSIKVEFTLKNVVNKLSCCSHKSSTGKSEVIAHGNGKNWEVQKPLLVTLNTDICLLRLLISLSTCHALCNSSILQCKTESLT